MQGTQGSDNDNSEIVYTQTELERELECIDMVQHIPVTDQRLQEIKQATANDSPMQQLITIIVTGWPEARHEVTSYEIRQYYNVREDLVVQDGLISWTKDRDTAVLPTESAGKNTQLPHWNKWLSSKGKRLRILARMNSASERVCGEILDLPYV